jgi:hypothetical protein
MKFYNIILKVLAFILISSMVVAQTFDFDDGTIQGWRTEGPYDNAGGGPYSSNFSSLQWSDDTNYPNALGSDPLGNNNGSVYFSTPGGHGISGAGGTFWINQFHSGDLSNLKGGTACYSNIFVSVFDHDRDSTRYFYYPESIPPLNRNAWNTITIEWDTMSAFPTNYTIQEIHINIWGSLTGTFSGAVYLDEATPLSGSGVIVEQPNGGENWYTGSTHDIIWSTNLSDVDIDYSTNGGSTWIPIAAAILGTTYPWTVPNTPSSNCIVRVSGYAGDTFEDFSDDPFTITSSPMITVTSSPPGRSIVVDAVTYTAPQTFQWVPGSSHTIGVTSPQTIGPGDQYIYSSWSDAGAQSHTITTPGANTTYTANFTHQYYLTMNAVPPADGGTAVRWLGLMPHLIPVIILPGGPAVVADHTPVRIR